MVIELAFAELFSCSPCALAALACCLGPTFFLEGLTLLTGAASASLGWLAAADAGCSVFLRLDLGYPSSPMVFFLTTELPQVSCTLLRVAIG